MGHRFEALADDLDPEAAQVEDLAGLRAIAEAAERARRDEALSPNGSPLARAHGRSWSRIAALGVSRQASRQRFGGKIGAYGRAESNAQEALNAQHRYSDSGAGPSMA